jgi:glycosyltransferase involved in cell wall biosynthesis
MKWAILIPRILSEKDGGTKVYVDRFAKALLRRGDAVHIFTTSLDPSLPEHQEEGGVSIHRTFVASGTAGPLRFSVASRVTAQFVEIDARERFDVMNLHSAYLLNRRMLTRELPVILTFHAVVTYEYVYVLKKIISSFDLSTESLRELIAFPVKFPVSYIRERAALRQADAIVVMSEYVKGAIRTWFPSVADEKIFVSRIGIDVDAHTASEGKAEARAGLGIREDELAFLTVRRLVPRMGLENLIEAFRLSSERHEKRKMRLFIAGKGQLREKLEGLIRSSGIENRVTLLGFVPDELLHRHYRASDAFVMPTEQLEGFGIVSIEALASDLPIIATPAGANPEVVGPFCPEFVARSTSPEHISEKIDLFVEKHANYVGRKYSDDVRRIFDWDAIIDELEALIGSSEE